MFLSFSYCLIGKSCASPPSPLHFLTRSLSFAKEDEGKSNGDKEKWRPPCTFPSTMRHEPNDQLKVSNIVERGTMEASVAKATGCHDRREARFDYVTETVRQRKSKGEGERCRKRESDGRFVSYEYPWREMCLALRKRQTRRSDWLLTCSSQSLIGSTFFRERWPELDKCIVKSFMIDRD